MHWLATSQPVNLALHAEELIAAAGMLHALHGTCAFITS